MERLRREVSSRWAAPAWHPTVDGDGIEGVLLAVDTRPGEGRRSEYSVLTIELDDGSRVAWHAAGDIAAEQLAEHSPQVGDRVAVLYGGEAESKRGGGRYKRWAIAVDRVPVAPTPSVDLLADGRDEIGRVLNGIEDVALRHRAKRTFARRFGRAPQYLDDSDVGPALVWARRAARGDEELDAPEMSVTNKERGSE